LVCVVQLYHNVWCKKTLKKVAKTVCQNFVSEGFFCLCSSKNCMMVYVDTNTQAWWS